MAMSGSRWKDCLMMKLEKMICIIHATEEKKRGNEINKDFQKNESIRVFYVKRNNGIRHSLL
jgi:hypothetical protein